jgi:signal transduction histidine kinase
LHPETPERIRHALGFLATGDGDAEPGLLAALGIIREALRAENGLQRTIVTTARRSAEAELAVAAVALLATPLLAVTLLVVLRRRWFRSLARLSDLLENVGNQDFRSTAPVGDRSDPLAVVFDRYNAMAEKLEIAQRSAAERATSLENQVRAASETLLRQQAELEHGARLAALGEFAARLAHELRNPISGISIALRNLEVEVEDPEKKERIVLIADEMDRVTRLLNALLEQGRSSPEQPARVDTRALVEDVVHLFACQLPEAIAVAADVEAVRCLLPRDTVRQVLINLLRNSREAIGDAAGRIAVALRRDGRVVRLTVSDDGPGYPDDLLRDGIRPFRSDKETGTGLGMSIVRRLVEAAGGDVALQRGNEGGAVTVVTLPCRD